jgi:hypothetical protein
VLQQTGLSLACGSLWRPQLNTGTLARPVRIAMPPATPLEFARENGARVSVLDLPTRRRFVQAWHETFARAVKTQTGKWVHLGYEWHAFSYEFTRSKNGVRALALYLAEAASEEVYVVPEDEGEDAFVCHANALLDFSDCQTDILVFPAGLDWTVAFTHEQPDLGPYFSRSEWCSQDTG